MLEVSRHTRSQTCAVPTIFAFRKELLMVGKVLRCTRGGAVHVDRTHSPSKTGVTALMANPTRSHQSSGRYGSAGRFEDDSR